MSNLKRKTGKLLNSNLLSGALILGLPALVVPNAVDLFQQQPEVVSEEKRQDALERINSDFDRFTSLQQEFQMANAAVTEAQLYGDTDLLNANEQALENLPQQMDNVNVRILKNMYLNPYITGEDLEEFMARAGELSIKTAIREDGERYQFKTTYVSARDSDGNVRDYDTVDPEFYQSCRVDAEKVTYDNIVAKAEAVHDCMGDRNDSGTNATFIFILALGLFFLRGMSDYTIQNWARLPKPEKNKKPTPN